MEIANSYSHRKLIDMSAQVFDILSMDAERQSVSLKRYIEILLDERARSLASKAQSLDISPDILRLVGSALPAAGKVEDIDDDRLEYLLSK